MKFIDITRDPNPLTRWQWRFWYDERSHALILDSYATLERPTKRHKFQATEAFNRIDKRTNSMAEQDVMLPSDVRSDAIRQFIDGLMVLRWSDHQPKKGITQK